MSGCLSLGLHFDFAFYCLTVIVNENSVSIIRFLPKHWNKRSLSPDDFKKQQQSCLTLKTKIITTTKFQALVGSRVLSISSSILQ